MKTIIRTVDPQGPDALMLLGEAATDARLLYPELFPPGSPSPANPPWPARGVYLVAYADGRPLACGALWPLDETCAEVRRMYVHRDHRRAGLAKAILDDLVNRAARAGFTRLVLETGHRQSAAMRLYEANGFTRIPPFGKYADDPTSVCYERVIG
jgi:GNAT superfamily N-acetyltransferase